MVATTERTFDVALCALVVVVSHDRLNSARWQSRHRISV